MIVVSWESSDLSQVTPTSAPVLPTSIIAQYEASVSAGSRPDTVKTTKTSPSGPGITATSTPRHNHTWLSTGAKAGISIGVFVATLVGVILVLLYLRLIKRPRELHQSSNARGSIGEEFGYAPRKSEARELAAEREPQEIAADLKPPPPIPFASKPQVTADTGSNPAQVQA